MVVIGIDAHKRTHTLVAVDTSGKKLGEKTVEATSAGHADALLLGTCEVRHRSRVGCGGQPLRHRLGQ
jgi:hypothetical protein